MQTREQELEAQLKALQMQHGAPPTMAPQPMAPAPMAMQAPQFAPQPQPMQAWGQQMPQPMAFGGPQVVAQPRGFLVGVNIPTPEGEATCYLEFGPEACANPQAVVMQLLQQGWPVKVWRPSNGGGGGGYGGGGGGYGGGGNGFGGGGFRRRWGR
jgi:uncharacterized membrane protein YgcG